MNRVRYQKETIFLTKGKSVVAKIVPTESSYLLEKELKEAKISLVHGTGVGARSFLHFLKWLGQKLIIGLKKGKETGGKGLVLLNFGFKKWFKLAASLEA